MHAKYMDALRTLSSVPAFKVVVDVLVTAEAAVIEEIVDQKDETVLRQLQGAAQLLKQLREHRVTANR